MFEFLTASQNMPFTVALVVMFGIAVLEGITAFFGATLSSILDSLLPDLPDTSLALDTDINAGIDGVEIQSPNALSRLLSWLRIGQVPVLMLIVVFLTGFGLIGLGIQSFSQNTLGFLWPAAIAAVPAGLMAMPVVRLFGGLLARIMPGDESDAVALDTLVGRIATITIGVARAGRAAEARVRDTHGTTHYVMVEPDSGSEEFAAGSEVLLVRRNGPVFTAIANTNPSLVGH